MADGCPTPYRVPDEADLEPEDDEVLDCPYCRGTGLSPYSIHDVPCRHCGGRG
jgi:hypothetical protein